MVKAQRDSIRLLQGALVAAVALPLALFVYASWLGWQRAHEVADRQIERTTDVINEHALKVFEAVERTIAEVNEVVRDLPDSLISAQQAQLHARLKRLAEEASQVKSVWIFGWNGRALVNSISSPVDDTDFSDRDYFKVHVGTDIGTYVGAVLRPRPPYGGAPFFGVSQRRPSRDGSFNGVVQVSVLPDYFEGFYAKLAREPGSYASLIRDDGLVLARYPSLTREARLAEQGPLYQSMLNHPESGKVTLVSAIDGTGRSVSYRKLAEFPVFVLAGLETAAIREQWLSEMRSQLVFGLPATAALIAIIALALRRTRRLYAEAAARQAVEAALKQSQRLEALGQLTGGVAHDFNNLLMVIGGSIERLKSLPSNPQASRSLAMMDAAVQKGVSLTRQLLSFSRRQSLSAQVFDIVECVTSFLDVLRQSLRDDMDLRFKPPADVIAVKVDRNELEIALLNLTLNARDAMLTGGVVTLSVETVTLSGAPGLENLGGAFVAINVADTGEGIPEAIRDRVFEPYFSTKKVDKGTGLGLSQVYGFAAQSGGAVAFASEVGRGTTFTLYLPHSSELPRQEPVHSPTTAAGSGISRVLLVEDNFDVAQVAADYLEQCGCSVLRADCAEAAVELLRSDTRIELVFSDIVMPGMNGFELARLVRDQYPSVCIILASGYSDKAEVAVAEGFVLLNKPYSLAVLRQALADARAPIRAVAI